MQSDLPRLRGRSDQPLGKTRLQDGLATHSLMRIATVPVCHLRCCARGHRISHRTATARTATARRQAPLADLTLGSAQCVRDDGTFKSVGLAVEADAAGLGYAIAIEGLLGPELQRGDVVRKAIETCHLSSQEEISSPFSGGGTTGGGGSPVGRRCNPRYELCTTSFHRQ